MTNAITTRLRVALVATALLAMLAVGVTAAGAAKNVVNYKGGTTTLTPASSALSALSAAGITASAVKPATLGAQGFSFPIRRGGVNTNTHRATLAHKGGVKYSKSGKSVTLRNLLILHGKTGDAGLYATAKQFHRLACRRHHRHCRVVYPEVRIARITDLKISSDGKTMSGTVKITNRAAQVTNKLAGATVFKAGDTLGTATAKAKTS